MMSKSTTFSLQTFDDRIHWLSLFPDQRGVRIIETIVIRNQPIAVAFREFSARRGMNGAVA